MSVVKMGLVPGRNSSFGKITENKSKLRFMAETDNNLDDEVIVADYGYSNVILPIPYISFHPNFDTQLCRSISFDQDSSAPRKWEIEATYSSEPLAQPQQYENPLDRPAKIKWQAQAYKRAISQDIDGKAIVNSAGDAFDPPVEIDASRWSVMVQKNVLVVPTTILDYNNSVNSSGFSIQGVGIGAKVAMVMDIEISDQKYEGDFAFFEFGYTLEFHPETWQLKVLDQGFRKKDFDNSAIQITDDSTPPRPITHAKLLDGTGGVLADPSPDNAVFLDFDVYPEKDFTVLPGLSEFS